MDKLVYSLFFFLMASIILPIKSFGQSDRHSSKIEIKKLPKLYLEEVVNNKHLELLPKIFSADYVFHGMDGKDSYSIKDGTLASFLTNLFKAFPDLHYTIDPIIAEGDKVAVNCTATGTHKVEFLGIPALGNKITFKEIFIFRIMNDKIVEGWGVVDILGVQQQMKRE